MHSLKRIKGSVLGCFFSAVLGGSLRTANMFPESQAFLFYKHLEPTGSCTNVSQKALLLSIIFRRGAQSPDMRFIVVEMQKFKKKKKSPGSLREVRGRARVLRNKGKAKVLCTPWTQ